jgi:hypothetical protein
MNTLLILLISAWIAITLWFSWHFINHFGYEINKWFEMNWGWFFVNGRKQSAWAEYLRKKYRNE